MDLVILCHTEKHVFQHHAHKKHSITNDIFSAFSIFVFGLYLTENVISLCRDG